MTMHGLTIATSLGDVGAGLKEAFFMFWETLWALVLGFALSGAVQAFVSRDEMRRVLGDRRPATVARATGLGAVSSSCSYAATAMAKSLFQKGADFFAAMVFMFHSVRADAAVDAIGRFLAYVYSAHIAAARSAS